MPKKTTETKANSSSPATTAVGGFAIHETTEHELPKRETNRYTNLVLWFKNNAVAGKKFTVAIPEGIKPASFRASVLLAARQDKDVKLSTSVTTDGKGLIVWREEIQKPVLITNRQAAQA